MRFEWDEAKNKSNRRKHGIDFYTASLVFDDAQQILVADRIKDGEQRWKALGSADGQALLVVVHTYREEGEEVIRIISARKAERFERRIYENNL